MTNYDRQPTDSTTSLYLDKLIDDNQCYFWPGGDGMPSSCSVAEQPDKKASVLRCDETKYVYPDYHVTLYQSDSDISSKSADGLLVAIGANEIGNSQVNQLETHALFGFLRAGTVFTPVEGKVYRRTMYDGRTEDFEAYRISFNRANGTLETCWIIMGHDSLVGCNYFCSEKMRPVIIK